MNAVRAGEPQGRPPLIALQLGALLVVLAALPYPLFQLDRYTFAKELVVLATATVAVLLCLGSARRLTVFMVDLLIAGFLLLTLLSTWFAANRWLAARGLGLSLASAGVFWAARTVARSGHGSRLLATLAAAVVLGGVTGLIQAYGLITTDLTSASRAPGGTFGNRNFMAHLAAIGLPLLILLAAKARTRRGVGMAIAGVAVLSVALVLSRSRAAWLSAAAAIAFLAVEGLWVGRLWADPRVRRRMIGAGGIAVAGVLLALMLPNRLNWRSDSPYLDSLTGVANYKAGSGRGRVIQYGNTLAMAMDHPLLGVGPGNWPVHYSRYMSPDDPSFDPSDVIPTNPWPSSDWVAALAERGLPATALLVAVGVAIALGAWSRLRSGKHRPPDLGDLTIVATLIAIVVVSAFDAVLLLPAPAFIAWTSIGALASSARPVRETLLPAPARRRLMLAVAFVGSMLLLHSFCQVIAMAVAKEGDRSSLELAAKLDPGSYRIHMLLAQQWRTAGHCGRARPHAERARALYPNHPAPRALLRACGAT